MRLTKARYLDLTSVFIVMCSRILTFNYWHMLNASDSVLNPKLWICPWKTAMAPRGEKKKPSNFSWTNNLILRKHAALCQGLGHPIFFNTDFAMISVLLSQKKKKNNQKKKKTKNFVSKHSFLSISSTSSTEYLEFPS